MDIINHYDHIATLALNSLHTPYFDNLFWLISKTASWAVLYIAIIYLLYKKFGRNTLIIFILLALTITLADQIASSLFKPLVQRLRPSHDPTINNIIHIVNNYKGGLYGFASSHAANTFAIATLTSLLIKKFHYTLTIYLWSSIVAYSRIYLGVHFLGDIIAGACIGIIVGIIISKLYTIITKRLHTNHLQAQPNELSNSQSNLFIIFSALNIIAIAIISTFNFIR